MARVLLITPRLTERSRAPYLGQQFVAAALLSQGHDVRCLDLSGRRYSDDVAAALATTQRFSPDIIGMTLFTWNALRGYELARALRGTAQLLIAGGPHATTCPEEALTHGFDAVIVGEGDALLPAVVDAVAQNAALPSLPGLQLRGHAPTGRALLPRLDGLAPPHNALACYDAADFGADEVPLVGGVLTSRGCPSRCTFCANEVTGRRWRGRSPEDVISELHALRDRGLRHFSFWDDAFTVDRNRVARLCDALRHDDHLAGCTWSCITPGTSVRVDDLPAMRDAGCISLNVGLESGDARVLRTIGKAARPRQIEDVVRAAKAIGMMTTVNIMFGFPDEGPDELDRTLAAMERIAPQVDWFSGRGVLVPYPGTAVYARSHERYGFTDWWLDPARIVDLPDPTALPPDEARAALAHDPTLDQNFFGYDQAIRERIEEGLRFKAGHNERSAQRMARQTLATGV